MTITNGKITFSRTVRPADFEGITSAVELSFTLPDGTAEGAVPGILDEIGALAKTKSLALINLRIAAQTSGSSPTVVETPAKATAAKKKGGAADMIIDPPAAGAQPSGGAQAETLDLGGGDAVETKADSLDDIMGLGASEPAPEITDADLNAKVQARNAVLKSPPLIRDLIIKFQPDDAKTPLLANVPQDRRTAFLAALEALTAA